MKIYLAQHGNQNSEEIDPNEGLSIQGLADVESVAGMAEFKPSKIFHSVKLRAKQTAQIFANHFGCTIEEKEGLKPMDDINPWIDKLEDGLMLVGHLPFMQKLSSKLILGNENTPCIKFHQGGVVGLEQNEDGKWEVDFFFIP